MAIFLVVAFAIYWPALNGPRVFDDASVVGDDTATVTMSQLMNLRGWLHPETRPLARFTFDLETMFFGTGTWIRRVGNILIHLLATAALFELVRNAFAVFFGATRTSLSLTPVASATAIAGIWMVHPLESAAVAYIAQRSEALMGLFFFLYLNCLVLFISTRKRRWKFLAVLCFVFGLWSKTVMVSAPAVGLLMDRAFFSDSIVASLRRQLPILLVPMAGCFASFWLLLPGIMQGAANVGFGGFAPPMHLHLAGQAKVFWLYLMQAIWPQQLSVDHCIRFPIDLSENFVWIVLTSTVVVASIVQMIRGRWIAPFFVVAPVCVLAVTSSFIPTADLWVDHRVYVPMASLSTGFVILVQRLVRRLSMTVSAGRNSIAIFGLIAAMLAFRTWFRAHEYSTAVNMFTQVVFENPDNDRGFKCLIDATRDENRREVLMPLLLKAEHIAKERGIIPAVVLGRIAEQYAENGDATRAIKLLSQAIQLDENHFFEGYREHRRDEERSGMEVNMGLAYASLGQLDESLRHLNLAFEFSDGSAEARAIAGSFSVQAGDINSAENHFQRAIELRPGWKEVEADLERIRQLR